MNKNKNDAIIKQYPHTKHASFADILDKRVTEHPDKLVFRFLDDGEREGDRLTFSQLAHRARQLAGEIQTTCRVGDRVALVYPSGLDFVVAYFACIYAGVIAVPAYPPRPNQGLARLDSLVSDCDPALLLTNQQAWRHVKKQLSTGTPLAKRNWLDTDTLSGTDVGLRKADVKPTDLAFLQYTSGSTGHPKGVMVSHFNLLENSRLLYKAMANHPDSSIVSWLPLYHDMGLIVGVLQAVYGGFCSTLMAPTAFVQKPIRWLNAISTYQARVSGAPNFAYDLCRESITGEQIAQLNLRQWEIAFCGAEPIRVETIKGFEKKFAAAGFSKTAFHAAYGTAETTLIISSDPQHRGLQWDEFTLTDNKTLAGQSRQAVPRKLVYCGKPWDGYDIQIVDPDSRRRCPPGTPGEIWINGPCVSQGYWGKPEVNQQAFAATLLKQDKQNTSPYFRTGDLGFFHRDHLIVCGRLKELIVCRGQNIHPYDLERTVSNCHPGLATNGTAAVCIDSGKQEKVVVFQEIKRSAYKRFEIAPLFAAIVTAVKNEFGMVPDDIVLLKPARLRRTTSCKIQRVICRDDYMSDEVSGEITRYTRWQKQSSDNQDVKRDTVMAVPDAQEIKAFLRRSLGEKLGLDGSDIAETQPLADLGLDSVAAVRISGELSDWLGRPVDATVAYDFPTLASLANYLTTGSVECRQQNKQATVTTATPQHTNNRESIAIVGMSCRFPRANNLTEFWHMLVSGTDAIREMAQVQRYHGDIAIDPAQWLPGGYLDNIDLFDADWFGIAPKEATQMDPQQRLLLEQSVLALHHAGYAISQLKGADCGVFTGICHADYERLAYQQPDGLNPYSTTGNALSMASNRVSYALDFQGPSLVIDTACSSSLVALHYACQALRLDECRMAIAAGVNLLLTPEISHALRQAGMLAPDGRCKTFSDQANGYVRGEGCGVLVLKRLSDAQADGDRILATIKGSAVAQDGRTNGITAPSSQAQAGVIHRALRNAGVSATDISMVETHGTGTALGDPIEIAGLQQVFGENVEVALSSVKANIGHLESAAGIAGVIKTVLCLNHKMLPPQLHLDSRNHKVAWQELPFTLNSQAVTWKPETARPRNAGVSSFGFGGTIAHVILEESVQPKKVAGDSAAPLSSITTLGKALPEDRVIPLDSVAPLAIGSCRRQEQINELIEQNQISTGSLSLLNDNALPYRAARINSTGWRVANAKARSANKKPLIVFQMSGQGDLAPGVGLGLYRSSPVFRSQISWLDVVANDVLGENLSDLLYGDKTDYLALSRFSQPAQFGLQLALAELWKELGFQPRVVIGHSIGEVAAACLAGVLTAEEGFALLSERGRLMDQLCAEGAMLAVQTAIDKHELQTAFPELTVAAENSPRQFVLSGPKRAIGEAESNFIARGIACRRLMVKHAFHSQLMAPVIPPLAQFTDSLALRSPSLAWVSTVSGECVSSLDKNYWLDHVTAPVKYYQAMKAAIKDDVAVVIEIGVGQVLTGLATHYCDDQVSQHSIMLLPGLSVDDQQQELQDFCTGLADLYLSGRDVNWHALVDRRNLPVTELPFNPFSPRSFWLERVSQAEINNADTENQIEVTNLIHGLHWQRLLDSDAAFNDEPLAGLVSEDLINNLAGYSHSEMDYLNALSESHIAAAIAAIEGKPELKEKFQAAATAKPYLNKLYQYLVKSVATSKKFSATKVATPSEKVQRVGEILAYYGEHLLAVLVGDKESVDVLFGNKHYSLQVLYQYSQSYQRVANTFACLLAKVKPQHTLKILEIGAGTGSTTEYILPLLGDQAVEYTFTDISPAFLASARQKFNDYSFIDYRTLNLESSVAEQGIESGYYDIVIAANVVHATRSIRHSLNTIYQLLAPEGKLILVESTKIYPWFHLAFAMLEGWWRFDEIDIRQDYPLISESDWRRVLEEQDFTVQLALSDKVNPESVIVAQGQAAKCRIDIGRILISGDRNIGEQLAGKLVELGAQVEFITHPLDVEGGHGGLARLVKNSAGFHWLHIPKKTDFSIDSFKHHCNQFIELYQALMLNCADKVRRITLLTQDAQCVESCSSHINLVHSGLLGLGKTLALEQLPIPCVRMDIEAKDRMCSQLYLVAEKILSPAREPELALRNNQWWQPRLSVVQDQQPTEQPIIKAGYTYLVTGAFGGIGTLLVHWLVQQGATHIALLSRAAERSKLLEKYSALINKVDLQYFAVDVGDAEQLRQTIRQIKKQMPPIKGVFHSAMVLRDQMLQTLDTETLQAVMTPKVAGAWNLHRFTLDITLDHFVMFSSAAAMLGNPGQGAYAAANYFMDQLAHWRYQQKLPAKSINWGVWKAIGKAEELAIEAHFLRAAPWLGALDPQQGIAALAYLLRRPDWVQRGVFSINPEAIQPQSLGLNVQLYQALNEALIKQVPKAVPRFTDTENHSNQKTPASQAEIEATLISYCADLMGLPVDELNAQDYLLDKGFDSLMATRLAMLIKQTWPVEISLRDVFEINQVSAIACYIQQSGESAQVDAIPIADSAQPVPLTPAQLRCWFFDKLNPQSDFYNVTGGLMIEGDLDVSLWQQSVHKLVQRHHILQAVFIESDDDQGVWQNKMAAPASQVVVNRPPDYEFVDLTQEFLESGKDCYIPLFAKEAATPFDLSIGPLFRCQLLCLQPRQHVFIINMHHIVCDGWSLGIMMQELGAIYSALIQGKQPDLEPLPIQFADYAVWLANRMSDKDLVGQKSYWQQTLRRADMLLEFPEQKKRPEIQAYRGDVENFSLDAIASESLVEFAKSQNCTLFMVLAAAFNALVMAYTGRRDILLGSAFANRERPELASLIGFLSNTWVLRTQLEPDDLFVDVLQQVRTGTLAAYENQDVPFEQVVELINPPRSLAFSPLIQVMLILQKAPQAGLEVPGLRFQELNRCYQASKLDFTVSLIESESGMRGWIEYNTDLFNREFMQRMMADFVSLLRAVCNYPQADLRELLTKLDSRSAPRHLVFKCADNTSQLSILESPEFVENVALAENVDVPPGVLELTGRLDEQFRSAAEERPNTKIIIYRGKSRHASVSLQDLLKKAELVAQKLSAAGLKGAPVILVIDDIGHYLVHFWGAILAGCKPLTIAFPGLMELENPLITKMIHACTALQGALILTDGDVNLLGELLSVASVANVQLAAIDSSYPSIDISRLADSDELVAFYQLSSGSTGVSKCIPITHKGINHHILANCQAYQYRADGKSLNWIPMDHVVPLLTFHIRDVLMGRDQVQVDTKTILEDPLYWFELLEQEQVSETWAPNFAYQLVINAEKETQTHQIVDQDIVSGAAKPKQYDLSGVRQFLNAGEQVTTYVSQAFVALLARYKAAARAYMPAYGTAEVCTLVTCVDSLTTCRPHLRSSEFVSMGSLVAGTKARIVDAENVILPQGHVGYLQLQSQSLTPGYINRSSANTETFLEDGWYHTGDFGFIDAGQLYLCGRDKDQLVVNGVNLACQEVEAQLSGINGIHHPFLAAFGVADDATGSESVVIAFVPSGDSDPVATAQEIRTRIGKTLGLPIAALVRISETDYPQTTSGKLQRNQLQRRFVQGEFDNNLVIGQPNLQLAKSDSRMGSHLQVSVPDWFAATEWTRKSPLSELVTLNTETLVAKKTSIDKLWVKGIGDCDKALAVMQTKYPVQLVNNLADSKKPDTSFASQCDHLVFLLQPTIATLSQDLRALLVSLKQVLVHSTLRPLTVTILSVSERSMLLAILPIIRTIRQEEPDLSFRLLGVPITSRIDELAGELFRPISEVITYIDHHGDRWQPILAGSKMAMPYKTSAITSADEMPDGAYLISGGLGGIGFELAQRLLLRPGIKLIILGRQPIDHPAIQQRWQALLSQGVDRLQYYSCDIGDSAQLAHVLRCIAEPVVAVLHLAGILKSQSIRELSNADITESWQGKVHGAYHLATQLADPELAVNQRKQPLLFIHFSSINGFFGGVHVAAYSAACGYQAALAEWQRQRNQRAYCISWSAWRNIGMSPQSEAHRELLSARGFCLVEPQQAWISLVNIVQQQPGDWLVGVNTLHPFIAPYRTTDIAEPLQLTELPMQPPKVLSQSEHQTSEPGWSETEKRLGTLWESLLNSEIVSRDADFFGSGGHSLLALKLLAKINQAFSLDLGLIDLFQHIQLKTMARLIDDCSGQSDSAAILLPQWCINTNYPLTKSQGAVWYQYARHSGYDPYVMQGSMKVTGNLDTLVLQNAVYEIARRHSAMRLAFSEVEGRPVQWVLEEPNVSFRLIPRPVTEAQWQKVLHQEARKPLAVDQGESLRLCAATAQNGATWLAITTHHLFLDGFSIELLFDELWDAYDVMKQPNHQIDSHELPRVERQYIQYVLQTLADDQEIDQQTLAYWRQQLQNVVPAALPFVPEDIASSQADTLRFELDSTLFAKLERLLNRLDLSLNNFLSGTFGLLLRFYNGESHQAFLMPVSNRGNGNWLTTPGMFTNVLPVVVDVRDDPLLAEYYVKFDQSVKSSLKYESLSIEQLTEALNLRVYGSLYSQVMFASQDSLHNVRESSGLTVELCPVPAVGAKYGLSVHAERCPESYRFTVEFAKGAVEKTTLVQFIENYKQLLSLCIEHINTPVERVLDSLSLKMQPAISLAEKVELKQNHFLNRLQQQIDQHPNALAVYGAEGQLSFQQLDGISNQIAHFLLEEGVLPGDVVASLVPRNHFSVCFIVGILRAGGVFLPLEGDLPRQRARYQLSDSGCRYCLLPEDSRPLGESIIADLPIRILNAPLSLAPGFSANHLTQTLPDVNPLQAAYQIYTSGSSGRPKGVVVSHRNLGNLLVGLEKAIYQAHPSINRVLLTASFMFDASVQQWCTLALGKQLYVLDPVTKLEPSEFSDFIQTHQIELMDITPTLLRQVLPTFSWAESFLVAVLVGGEAISPELWQELANLQGTTFYNMYGPTEATVDVSYTAISQHYPPNIGFPLANNQLSVVDGNGKPCPYGALGEFVVEGESVALGYAGSQQKEFHGRYFTGDLGWMAADGRVFISGRNDDQVKISGYRVELGEIERTLSAQPGVTQAVVSKIDVQSNPKILASVQWQELKASEKPLLNELVSNDERIDNLKQACREWLPRYMMPHYWQSVDNLPLLPSGKVDRKAIISVFYHDRPSLAGDSFTFAADSANPECIEAVVTEVFSSVLARSHLKESDNFFSLGGDSVQTIQVAYLLRQKGIEIDSADVIKHPSVSALCQHIRAIQTHPGTPRDLVKQSNAVPDANALQLSPTQKGLLFHYLTAADDTMAAYVQQLECCIDGDIELSAWNNSWQSIIDNHSIFGIAIGKDSVGQWCSWFAPPASFKIQMEDWRGSKNVGELWREKVQSERDKPFDLAAPPLMRMLLIHVADGRYRFLWTFHHLLLDGWSLPVLWREFNSVYQSYCERKPVDLNLDNYQDYLQYLQAYPHLASKNYWKNYLREVTKLRSSEPGGKVGAQRKSISLTPSDTLREALTLRAQAHQVSKVTLLLVAWGQLMRQRLQSDDVVFGAVLSGRPEALADMDSRVGLYINTVPIRCDWDKQDRLAACLQKMASSLADCQQHQYIGLGAIKQAAGCGPNQELFDSLLTVENYPMSQLEGGTSSSLFFHDFQLHEQTHYPLAMKISMHQGIECELQYCASRCAPEQAKQLLTDFERILEWLAKLAPDSNLESLHESSGGNDFSASTADFLAVFRQVLTEDQVSLQDNFIRLGGDSIQAMQIAARLQNIGYKVTTQQILTANELGALLTGSDNIETSIGDADDSPELTPMQNLFLNMEHPNPHHWNQCIALQVPLSFDIALVSSAMERLVERHPLLQGTVDLSTQQIRLNAYSVSDAILNQDETKTLQLSDLIDFLHTTLDVEKGPLWRMCLLKQKDTQYLIWAMHHLIVDGVSWRILCYELDSILHSASTGERLSLVSQGQSPRLLPASAGGKAVSNDRQVHRLRNLESLPHQQTQVRWSDLVLSEFELSRDETRGVTELAALYKVSIESLLVAALLRSVYQLNDQSNISLTIEKHGRQYYTAEVNHSIGWYTDLETHSFALSEQWDASRWIRYVADVLEDGAEKSLLYSKPDTDPSQPSVSQVLSHIADVMFNYLGKIKHDSSMRYLRWADLNRLTAITAVAGENYLLAPVNINCAIYNDQLKVELQCHQRMLGSDWCNALTTKLEKILRHWSQQEPNALNKALSPLKTEVGNYCLTPVQKGMLVEIKRNEGKTLYITQSAFSLKGVNIPCAIKAWQHVVLQHQVLRYSLSTGDPATARWQLNEPALDSITHKMISLEDGEDEKQQLLTDEITSMDIFSPPLIKALILEQGNTSTLAITAHHLVSDGWSQSILWQEWFHTYSLVCNGLEPEGHGIDCYSDYFDFLASRDMEAAKEFWCSQLAGLERPTRLTHLYKSDQEADDWSQSNCVQSLSFELNSQVVSKLTDISKELSISSNSVFQALWHLTLCCFSDNQDPVFGTVFSGRDPMLPQVESRVGLYINVIPVRLASGQDADFSGLLRYFHDFFIEASEHQWLGLQEILNCVEMPLGGLLFDTLLAFENYPVNLDGRHLEACGFELIDSCHQDSTHYPLVVRISQNDTLTVEFSYQADKLTKSTVNLLAEFYIGCISNLEQLVGVEQSPRIISPVLAHFSTLSFADAGETLPIESVNDRGLVARLLDNCRLHPERIAVQSQEGSMSYDALYQRASAIANTLVESGVEMGDVIGICHEDKSEGIIAMVACALLRCPYVPLDPALGRDRLQWMITETSMMKILVDSNLDAHRLLKLGIDVIDQSGVAPGVETSLRASVEYATTEPLATESLITEPLATEPLYILFTSGTTGVPKGVVIGRDSIVHLCCVANPVPVNESSRVSQTSTQLFDFSQYEIWSALLNGGTCVTIPKEKIYDPVAFADYIAQYQINIITMPTGILHLMANNMPHSFDNADYVLFGGEACNAKVVRKLREVSLCKHIVNLYGPAECTVFCTSYEVQKEESGLQIPIGRSIPGVATLIVNDANQVLGEGMPGELCVTGNCLGLHYLHQKSHCLRTNIIDHTGQSLTVYRTGDRVMQLQGKLYFLGRIDSQLKVRGYRIDPIEIENRLRQCQNVTDAAVVGENNKLIAYVEAEKDYVLEKAKTWLAKKLPFYMVPNLWIRIDKFPRTINGKVDYKQLRASTVVSKTPGGVARYTDSEAKLAEIWCQLLQVSEIAKEDSFFDLGGHSLLVARLVNRIKQVFRIKGISKNSP